MSLLNLHPEQPFKKPSMNRLVKVLGIGGLIGAVALGSTFASNISLNGDQNVEFGQGVAQTTACDNQITITPYATFVNAPGAGSHKLTSIQVSGIDSSPNKCSGKIFRIRAYGDSGILELFNWRTFDQANPGVDIESVDYDTVEVSDVDGVFTWVGAGSDGDDITSGSSSDMTDTSFTLSLSSAVLLTERTPLALSESVKRITVETLDDEAGDGSPLSYYPSGPQQNVSMSTIRTSGWRVCYSHDYGVPFTQDSISDITGPCTGKYLLILGRATGGNTALLLSAALRSEIITQTPLNTPHLANGSWWYYTLDTSDDNSGEGSFGFSPNATINQSSCDYGDENETSQYRLCWHVNENGFGGYRIGTIGQGEGNIMNGGVTGYLKEVYQHS